MITSSDVVSTVYEAVSNLLWYHSSRLVGLRSRVSGHSIIAMLKWLQFSEFQLSRDFYLN